MRLSGVQNGFKPASRELKARKVESEKKVEQKNAFQYSQITRDSVQNAISGWLFSTILQSVGVFMKTERRCAQWGSKVSEWIMKTEKHRAQWGSKVSECGVYNEENDFFVSWRLCARHGPAMAGWFCT